MTRGLVSEERFISLHAKYILSNIQDIINGIILVFTRTAQFASRNIDVRFNVNPAGNVTV